MYCVRNVTSDLYWVGANDHRLALFENCFPIPRGVSYNAYCLLDEKTVLFDTVDWSACRQLLENLNHVLNGRELDYLLINHRGEFGYTFARLTSIEGVIELTSIFLKNPMVLKKDVEDRGLAEHISENYLKIDYDELIEMVLAHKVINFS